MQKFIYFPSSHAKRLLNLKRIYGMAQSETDTQFLEANMVNEVDALTADYEEALTILTDREALVRQTRDTLEPSIERLVLVMRSAWRSLRNRLQLEGLSFYLLDLYGLPRRRNPTLYKNSDWIAWAQKLVSGEAKAVAAGFEPMSIPSIAMLSAALDEAVPVEKELGRQLLDLTASRNHVNELAERSDIILRKVALALRLTMYEDKKPSRRQVMRRFGFRFKSKAGKASTETPDPILEPIPEPIPEPLSEPVLESGMEVLQPLTI